MTAATSAPTVPASSPQATTVRATRSTGGTVRGVAAGRGRRRGRWTNPRTVTASAARPGDEPHFEPRLRGEGQLHGAAAAGGQPPTLAPPVDQLGAQRVPVERGHPTLVEVLRDDQQALTGRVGHLQRAGVARVVGPGDRCGRPGRAVGPRQRDAVDQEQVGAPRHDPGRARVEVEGAAAR